MWKWSHPILSFCLEAKKWTSDLPNKKQPSYPLNGTAQSTAIIMQYIIPREYHLDLHCMITWSTITVKIQIIWGATLFAGCGVYEVSKACHTFILGTALLASEDEGNAFLQNINNHSPSDSVSHPRRLESSAATTFWNLCIWQVELQLLKKHGECHFVKWVADFSSSSDPWQTQRIALWY
jgi:hypothetical protein